VSLLQEYVQSCTSFSPHKKILTWSFDQQLENDTTLQFRATLSFMFNNIPHHFCGGWQSSKKKAQRDTAERVRHYLARTFEQPEPGAAANRERQQEEGSPVEPRSRPQTPGHRAAIDPTNLPKSVVEELWAAFEGRSRSASSGAGARDEGNEEECGAREAKLKWDIEDATSSPAAERDASGEACRATVTFYIHTVPHHFAGGWCANVQEARCDLAERVLWYFGMRAEGFSAADRPSAQPPIPSPASMGFSPARHTSAGAAVAPTSPAGSAATPSTYSPGSTTTAAGPAFGADPSRQAVEDKTILMQVQNALQKSFARETPPGQRVWVWSYEADEHDPQLFRAHVQVPCWGESFVGDWCRGKKLGQRSACLVVKAVLERRITSGVAGS